MAWDKAFESAFRPRAIAVVGVSRAGAVATGVGGGNSFIAAIQAIGYAGHIYPINPLASGEILGLKVYPNLASLPEPVDLVIVSVPAPSVLQVLQDCVAANAKNIHIYTAGFEETGDPEYAVLGKRIREFIQAQGLRVVGPNGMGLCYVPGGRLASWNELEATPGNIALVSQSGGNANDLTHLGPSLGLYFSKAVSFGNAYGFDSTDFLEYLAEDAETKIIGMYLEGVRDGRRLLRQVRDLNPVKPVVVWKGGLTPLGARAVRSHTASLAGERAIWDAFFKQTGAIPAYSVEDMADVFLALSYLPKVASHRAAIFVTGGGMSVSTADVSSREGLQVPVLSEPTLRELRAFIPAAGTIIRNPLDVGLIFRDEAMAARGLRTVIADPQIDLMVVSLNVGWMRDQQRASVDWFPGFLARFAREEALGKPVAAVLVSGGRVKQTQALRWEMQARLLEGGIPVFESLPRAARALARFADYHAYLGGREAE